MFQMCSALDFPNSGNRNKQHESFFELVEYSKKDMCIFIAYNGLAMNFETGNCSSPDVTPQTYYISSEGLLTP